MFSCKVLESKSDWVSALSHFDTYCPSSTFDFHHIYLQSLDSVRFVAIFLETNSSFLFYPFLLQVVPFSDGYFTATSCFGFSGPLFRGISSELGFLYSHLTNVLLDLHVVAEFIRLSPLPSALNSDSLSSLGYQVSLNRNLAFFDSQFGSFKSTCTMTRRATREGCIFKRISFKDKSSFLDLYHHTMCINNAANFFFYDDSYFDYIFSSSTDFIPYFFGVYFENKLISSSLFLNSGSYSLYHLGCSDRSVPGASDFMLRNACDYLLNNGTSSINFTGGRSSNPDDSLLKFKMRFSNHSLPFYIAFRSINKQPFEAHKQSYILEYPDKANKFIPWS